LPPRNDRRVGLIDAVSQLRVLGVQLMLETSTATGIPDPRV